MVRLKLVSPGIVRMSFTTFQSHNGSIKTSYIGPQVINKPEFQSHNGSIKTNIYIARGLFLCLISIPQWFD